ncbi:hypothetical protein TNCV_1545551 [Trichonephila clavipes]|nr:hypothetical protein TNCV_1545551 [Trichonephila clavipes]
MRARTAVPIIIHVTFDAKVHEQMYRFSGLSEDLQCLLRPEASLVLIYRPNVAGMKGRVDLAQPVNRTPDLWCVEAPYTLFTPLGESYSVKNRNHNVRILYKT